MFVAGDDGKDRRCYHAEDAETISHTRLPLSLSLLSRSLLDAAASPSALSARLRCLRVSFLFSELRVYESTSQVMKLLVLCQAPAMFGQSNTFLSAHTRVARCNFSLLRSARSFRTAIQMFVVCCRSGGTLHRECDCSVTSHCWLSLLLCCVLVVEQCSWPWSNIGDAWWRINILHCCVYIHS